MEENTDKFISKVRSFTPLWDMKDKRYHSRDIQRKLWAKVAEEVGGEGKFLLLYIVKLNYYNTVPTNNFGVLFRSFTTTNKLFSIEIGYCFGQGHVGFML